MKAKYERGQVLAVGKIVKIFIDPLAETGLEAEVVLIERLFKNSLNGSIVLGKMENQILRGRRRRRSIRRKVYFSIEKKINLLGYFLKIYH